MPVWHLENIINRNMKNKYDIVIIGSGIGGLASAALLSQAGKKILIVEKEPAAGGYLKGFKDGEFFFDPSLHMLNGCKEGRYTHSVFKKCNVINDIDFLKPKYLYRSVFPRHDIKVPQEDPEGFKKTLKRLFPGSQSGIEAFFGEVLRIFNGIANFDSGKLIPADIVSYFKKTADEIMSRYIDDPELKAIIWQTWSYFGLPPSKGRAVDFYYPWFDYIHNGGYYVRKGGSGLISALVSRLKNDGVEFCFNKDVDKIIIGDGLCRGVKIGRENVNCDAVVSGIDITKTVYDLIGSGLFPAKSIERIKSIEPSISDFEIFLGLGVDLRKKYPDDYEIFINPDYDIEAQYAASIDNCAEKTAFTIAIYSNLDDTVAPTGKSVVTINMLSGYDFWNGGSKGEYQDKKEKIANLLIRRASRIIPEIATKIEKKIVSTPITFKRYTNNSRGAIYGYCRTSDSKMEARPNDTIGISNLYFASAWARQGSGVEKVLRSADEVARRILRKETCQKTTVSS